MTKQLSADVGTISANLDRIRREVEDACQRADRDPAGVRICVATKYVDADGLQLLKDAGVEIAAENRLQDLETKQSTLGRDAFEWHFIGAIQSKKIREIAQRVELIHSLATESARDKLNSVEEPPNVLVQVNVSGEDSKQGVAPEHLAEFIDGCGFPVVGLMTMPPLTEDPESARPYFRRLSELAGQHGLSELSIGTSQDYPIAVEEGATVIRVGSTLFDPIDT
jgi:pyridoxal phosphate enzyme (YggS family)